MFLFKKEENGKLFTEFHDLYIESDDKQNWYFSASCLEESIKNFKKLHPKLNYKNTSLVLWLSNISALTGVHVSSFRNFEPQKGKTKLEGHYAMLKFSLKCSRWLFLPNHKLKLMFSSIESYVPRGHNVYEDCRRSQTIYDPGIEYFVMDNMSDRALTNSK